MSSKDNNDDIRKKSNDVQEAPSTSEQVENVVAEGNVKDSSCVQYNVELRVESNSEQIDIGEVEKVVCKFVEEKVISKVMKGKRLEVTCRKWNKLQVVQRSLSKVN